MVGKDWQFLSGLLHAARKIMGHVNDVDLIFQQSRLRGESRIIEEITTQHESEGSKGRRSMVGTEFGTESVQIGADSCRIRTLFACLKVVTRFRNSRIGCGFRS